MNLIMRRITKNIFTFLIGILLTVVYCEFLIYYVVVAQCSWPELTATKSPEELKALIIADTHLLGPRKGHWLDKWRREWQMHQAFQAIMNLHQPETVFILGDLFDEGEWSNDRQFRDYVQQFYKLFPVPENVPMQAIVGNHDIGFHYNIRPGSAKRFFEALNTSSVKMVTLKDSHFVLINSMAMEGDTCRLCREARYSIDKISNSLECSKNPDQCSDVPDLTYSQPILMQVTILPHSYAVNKCGLPKETTIAGTAVILVFLVSYYASTRRLIGTSPTLYRSTAQILYEDDMVDTVRGLFRVMQCK